MDNYIVSARKLVQTLKAAVVTRKLAHAYLFCGTRGVGKTTCARIFAKTINCEHPTPDGEACNECESCRAFNEQRSYNIIELDAASNNSVDEIRSLIDKVRVPPQLGRYPRRTAPSCHFHIGNDRETQIVADDSVSLPDLRFPAYHH